MPSQSMPTYSYGFPNPVLVTEFVQDNQVLKTKVNTYLLLLLRRLHQSEDVDSLCATGWHQIEIVSTEGQAADLDESTHKTTYQHTPQQTQDLIHLFMPLLNSSSFSPAGTLNTRITVPCNTDICKASTTSWVTIHCIIYAIHGMVEICWCTYLISCMYHTVFLTVVCSLLMWKRHTKLYKKNKIKQTNNSKKQKNKKTNKTKTNNNPK